MITTWEIDARRRGSTESSAPQKPKHDRFSAFMVCGFAALGHEPSEDMTSSSRTRHPPCHDKYYTESLIIKRWSWHKPGLATHGRCATVATVRGTGINGSRGRSCRVLVSGPALGLPDLSTQR